MGRGKGRRSCDFVLLPLPTSPLGEELIVVSSFVFLFQ